LSYYYLQYLPSAEVYEARLTEGVLIMKLAVDPCLLKNLSAPEMFASVAQAGYQAVELSPRDGFLEHRQGDRPRSEVMQSLKRASSQAGVEIASLFIVQPWASTDSSERQAAVSALKVAIDAAEELGCPRVNTEFTGTPDSPDDCREAFLRSLDEVLPTAERQGISFTIEPHPYDFIESNEEAVDLVQQAGSPSLRYLFCVPHVYHLGSDVTQMIEYARPVLAHVHLADTYRPSRVILNPPDPAARIHQHLDIGQGEVDWPAVFGSLAKIGFSDLATVAVFAWPDRAMASMTHNRAAARQYLES
jgi:myo-inositol catabolism protein IolH